MVLTKIWCLSGMSYSIHSIRVSAKKGGQMCKLFTKISNLTHVWKGNFPPSDAQKEYTLSNVGGTMQLRNHRKLNTMLPWLFVRKQQQQQKKKKKKKNNNKNNNKQTGNRKPLKLRKVLNFIWWYEFIFFMAAIFQRWNDCRISWNSSDYNNITMITVPYNKVWVPDIALYDR